MTALVTIAGTPIPDPSEYEATTATIVDSARNAQGVVVGSVIRNNVAKISMKWRYLPAQAWADILALFDPVRGGQFYNDVTFFCADTNRWETRKMYVSDRSASIFLRDANNPDTIKGYTNPKLDLIEV